ncbi:unnamed protein product [Oppiella nova]|uniref:3CxxC-type domain-containing protein n=1 Tax=Oppiella nova TaxID=334625 RepID=A0A7R9M9H2_9ACAR|nr:unnamed protein product [Oppiella nova]CAG2173111.1 unnamed protein product [Oppiella nova]
MVVFNTPLPCMPSPPLTLWTTSLPGSPCPLISPMPSVSPLSSSHCSSLAPSPTTTLPIASPLSLSAFNYGTSVVIRPTTWNQSYGMEQKCGHGWTSMKGRVVFWFDLLSPYYSNGFVAFKLYGQQCDRCKTDGYEQAMWYPEEVCKVLTNLYNKVGQLFYGFYQPPIEKTRRSGKPRTPHNSDLCQACKDGLCADRK